MLLAALFVTTQAVEILLDRNATPAPGVFNDVAAAIEAVNRAEAPVTLLVAPGVYWLDDPDDPSVRVNKEHPGDIPYGRTIKCDTLVIKGLDPDPRNTVFASNRGQTQGALGNFTMIHFIGSSLEVHNMTLGNFCNVDLEYPLDPSQNRPKRGEAIVQAQVGICTGTDRLFSSNCRYISRLNLCPMVGARRSLYKNCHFESTDDALTGSAVYLGCHFTFHSGKPFYNTPPTGAVFLDCDIDVLTRGVQYFTKLPGPVSLIDTRLHGAAPGAPAEVCWCPYPSTSVSFFYNVTLDGKPLTIDSARPELAVNLDGKEALNAYRVVDNEGKVIYNIPSLVGGDDGWDPLGLADKIVAATGNRNVLQLPVALLFDDNSVMLNAKDTIDVKCRPVRWGGYGSTEPMGKVAWGYPSVFKPETSRALEATFVVDNYLPQPVEGLITASTGYGLSAVSGVRVEPFLTEAPQFAVSPQIKYDRKTRSLRVEYSLDSDEPSLEDRSHIVWYRYRRDDMSDTIPLLHGSAATTRVYRPSAADAGSKIAVTVAPALWGARTGAPVVARFDDPLTGRKPKTETLTTNFANVPVHHQPTPSKGAWSFDSYKPADTAGYDWQIDNSRPAWYYGRGTDGATGVGLVQATRGARAFYLPATDASSRQQLAVVLQPCKTAGQGFGSATGQYLDIYIGFDPATLSGYGLRIERTPDYDKAVVFSLVRYDNGRVSPLTTPVASSCYRSDCVVNLSLENGVLKATAATDATPVGRRAGSDVVDEVMLEVAVGEKTPGNGIGFQHTGSTGASATLISEVTASWK